MSIWLVPVGAMGVLAVDQGLAVGSLVVKAVSLLRQGMGLAATVASVFPTSESILNLLVPAWTIGGELLALPGRLLSTVFHLGLFSTILFPPESVASLQARGYATRWSGKRVTRWFETVPVLEVETGEGVVEYVPAARGVGEFDLEKESSRAVVPLLNVVNNPIRAVQLFGVRVLLPIAVSIGVASVAGSFLGGLVNPVYVTPSFVIPSVFVDMFLGGLVAVPVTLALSVGTMGLLLWQGAPAIWRESPFLVRAREWMRDRWEQLVEFMSGADAGQVVIPGPGLADELGESFTNPDCWLGDAGVVGKVYAHSASSGQAGSLQVGGQAGQVKGEMSSGGCPIGAMSPWAFYREWRRNPEFRGEARAFLTGGGGELGGASP